MASRTSRELPSGSGVDTQDEPSARWGWHGGFPRGSLIGGWATVVILLAFNFGNHEGRIENIWLTGIALLLAAGLVRQSLHRRHAWRR